MPPKNEKHDWELPHLVESHQLSDIASDFWSVKFYPYTEPGVDPIFAAVGGKNILICRLSPNKPTEIIQSISDEELDANNFSCAWTKEVSTEIPLLCVAGDIGKIHIINALTGQLHRTLAGHGGAVNDLAISPTDPQILASASEDLTVRLWSLDPAHEKEPCAAILAGDGHRENVLTISFHATGKYLLSGGVDHIINLWVLPDLPDANTGTHRTTRIHYPHFSTSEVHSRHVDCVAFHNDLILSKCDNEDCIVIWSISGFSSKNPPPPPLSAPTTHDSARDTRSAFTSATSSPDTLQYTRLLQFAVPDSTIMFTRFGFYPGSSTSNPVLAMCNTVSKVFFWDLARLGEYHDYINSIGGTTKPAPTIPPDGSIEPLAEGIKRPAFLIPYKHRARRSLHVLSRVARETSPTESTSTDSNYTPSDKNPQGPSDRNPQGSSDAHAAPRSHPATANQQSLIPGLAPADATKSLEIWSKRYSLGDPYHNLTSHKDETIKGFEVVGRQIAWSKEGEWCVVVGSGALIAVFERWQK